MIEPNRKTNEERLLALLHRLGDLQLRRGPLKEAGVSFPQMALLGLVARSPGCHLQDIAAQLGLTAPTVSVGVRRLVKAGWLERKPDPEDKRARRIYLTEKGEGMQERVRQHRHEAIRRFLVGLNQQEQEQLLGLMEKAINAAEEAKNPGR
jgi:DNA-binding MarR family transcriptional regulator